MYTKYTGDIHKMHISYRLLIKEYTNITDRWIILFTPGKSPIARIALLSMS